MATKTTVTAFMEIDTKAVMKLTEKELKKVVRSMQKSISQRIRRLHAKGIYDSPAESYIKRVGTPKTVNDDGTPKNLNQLRNQLLKGRNFFNAKSSTITGYKEVYNYWVKELGQVYADSSEGTKKNMWKAYRKYEEAFPGDFIKGKYASFQVRDVFIEHVKDTTDPEEFFRKVAERYGHSEQEVEEKLETGEEILDVDTEGLGVSRFF